MLNARVEAPSLTLLADDLTGLCDSALAWHQAGLRQQHLWVSPQPLLTQPTTLASAVDVLGVCTASRLLPPWEAYNQLLKLYPKLLAHAGQSQHGYKKIDSTLRGPLLAELAALQQASQADLMVVAPAYPSQQRQTIGGYQLLRGLPIELTEVGRDPQNPVRKSHLPTLLQQQAHSLATATQTTLLGIGHISLTTVMQGAGPLVQALKQQLQLGNNVVVVDAATATDLDQLALALSKMERVAKLWACGSGGLAHALAATDERHRGQGLIYPQVSEPLPEGLPCVVLSGSTTPLNWQQLQHLQQHCQRPLLPLVLSLQQWLGQEPLDPLIAQLEAMLEATLANQQPPPVVLISTVDSPETRLASLADAMADPLFEQPAPHFQVLQPLLSRLLNAWPQAMWVLCGGETSAMFCGEAGITSLCMVGALAPAIPILQAPDKPLWVVTKSGNLGRYDTLTHVVATLTNPIVRP